MFVSKFRVQSLCRERISLHCSAYITMCELDKDFYLESLHFRLLTSSFNFFYKNEWIERFVSSLPLFDKDGLFDHMASEIVLRKFN